MKVRIGVGTGAIASMEGAEFGRLVDDIEQLGFDSIWLPEILTAPAVDPLVGLAFAAAHNSRLKLGTTMLLPGRNLVRLAKSLAGLDRLSSGRLLVTLVPGLPRASESAAAGTDPRRRGPAMDEMLPLLRRLWAGESVTYHGDAAQLDEVTISPLPLQQPLEFWTGGMVPAALRRCGRFADGWLPSACTPSEVATAKAEIERVADESGRTISPEHFGVSIGYARHPLSPQMKRGLSSLRRGVDAEEVVPIGLGGLRSMLERFLEVGFSKFVVRPVEPIEGPGEMRSELEALAQGVLDLQT
jgi:probable F420-dependent oxidoreductase